MLMKREIWFVDDDEIFRLVVGKLMEETPHSERIRLFDDGAVALLELVSRSNNNEKLPALIFLDLGMRQLEGWQMIDMLNEIGEDLNIVIVSSSDNRGNRDRAEDEPLVMEMIGKPITAHTIQKMIRKYGNK